MTLDDMEILFRNKIAAGHEIRAGIAAVVRALRDEIVPPTKSRAASSTMLTRYVLAGFNEILGDAGAAAGGSAERDDEQRATAPAADLTVGQRLIKAAKEAASMAKADAVCIWTHGQKGWMPAQGGTE